MTRHDAFMRTVVAFLALLVASPAFALNTAYEAMRVVGQQKGATSLEKVVEVRGVEGAPQPTHWKITVVDEKKSGLKEFDVDGVKLAGDRSVKSNNPGKPINLNQLNLDSDGAHTLADREAKKVGFAFDRVNYLLRTGSDAVPMWQLSLMDTRTRATATFHISADTGNIVGTEGLPKVAATAPPVTEQNLPPVPPPPAPEAERPPEPERSSGNKVTNFIDRVGRHMDRRMHQVKEGLQNTFSGDGRSSGPQRSGPDAGPEAPHADPTADRPKD